MPGKAHNMVMMADIERKLASCWTVQDIMDHCDTEYGVSSRTVKRYVAKIRAAWLADEETRGPERRSEFRAMMREAWRDAKKAGDHRAVAAMSRTVAKLDGLEAPVQHQVAVGIIDVRAMSPAERSEEINALLAKRAESLDGRQAGAVQVLPAPAKARKAKAKAKNGKVKSNGKG